MNLPIGNNKKALNWYTTLAFMAMGEWLQAWERKKELKKRCKNRQFICSLTITRFTLAFALMVFFSFWSTNLLCFAVDRIMKEIEGLLRISCFNEKPVTYLFFRVPFWEGMSDTFDPVRWGFVRIVISFNNSVAMTIT